MTKQTVSQFFFGREPLEQRSSSAEDRCLSGRGPLRQGSCSAGHYLPDLVKGFQFSSSLRVSAPPPPPLSERSQATSKSPRPERPSRKDKSTPKADFLTLPPQDTYAM